MRIYKKDGKYQGKVEAGGRQVDHDFIVDFEEVENRLDAYFVEQNPDKLPPLHVESGTKMFSLIKKDEGIYTILHAYSVVGVEKGEETIVFTERALN